MHNVERALQLLKQTHTCPHCSTQLSLVEAPSFAFADGLGWGDFLWLCMNDECKYLTSSWGELQKKYHRNGGARYGLGSGEKKGGPVLVYGLDAFKDLVVDEAELERKEKEKDFTAGFNKFNTAIESLAELERFLLEIDREIMAQYVRVMRQSLENGRTRYVKKIGGE